YSAVVDEVPELEVRRDARVTEQLVRHFRPARRARQRPVHEHDRYPARSIRAQKAESVGPRDSRDLEIRTSKARDLEIPDRRAFQQIRERGRRLLRGGPAGPAHSATRG